MWPNRALCDLLQFEIPIIQAPMAGSTTPALTSAVSNAGGLGSHGCGGCSVPEVRKDFEALKAGTNRPFNLNFFANDKPKTDQAVLERTRERLRPWYEKLRLGAPPDTLPELGPGFDEERLALMLELRPAVVSFHFGYPDAAAIAAMHAAGIKLISSATSVSEAKALQAVGFDAIIAQGWRPAGTVARTRPPHPPMPSARWR